MYYHFRKTRKRYSSFERPEKCQFCTPQNDAKRIVAETEHAFVIENRTHYDQWELRRVIDHLLIIPKRHVLGLNELQADERADIMDIIAEYEGVKGYEIYARSPKSASRSVAHQHTHLIKTDHQPGRGMFFLKKPYILWRIP